MPATLRPFALLLIAATTACSTYDFAQARRADGSYDMAKLIADLESSGRECLDEGIWIPLLYLDLVTFEKSRPTMPAGYHLTQLTSYGPMFCAGSRAERYVDRNGDDIEWADREWVGWGVLYHDRDDYVETTHGTRLDGDERFLLLFGSSVHAYSGPKR